MTVLVLLTGELHRVVGVTSRRTLQLVDTACGQLVALTGSPPDPTSAYQHAVFPLAFYPTRCPRCAL